MPVELIVPEVGESITEVMIGRWLVEEGQAVKKDDPVVEIETDKVTLELPAPVAGIVSKHGKEQGDEASVGDVIGLMEEGKAAQSERAGSSPPPEASKAVESPSFSREAKRSAPAAKEQPSPAPAAKSSAASEEDRIMPAARRLLEENHLSAQDVTPTGPGGRLLKEDVQRHLDERVRTQPVTKTSTAISTSDTPTPAPRRIESAPTDLAAEEQVVPMSPMRRRIAQRLVEAQQNAALLTTFNEVDMTAVMDLRNRYKQSFQDKFGVKLGFMSFFVKAAIDALKQFPAVNAEIRGTNIIYKNHYDIGIAIGSGKGLVVPIVRNAEAMSFAEVELAIGDFSNRIKDNKLKVEELSGGTFTITNGGVFGSLLSTPIVNPPQSAVLGMHAIQQRPMAINNEVKIRPMMYLALTYDHRLVDGREAVSFLKRIKDTIEEPSRMLMEV